MASSETAYVALCGDRQVRHNGTFPTIGQAADWTINGLCCLGRHRVILADMCPTQLGTADG
jgi:hypothetical protein